MKACRRARTSVELAEYSQGIEIKEIGGYLVSPRPCGDTVSDVGYEYEEVKPQLEQIRNIASQKKVHELCILRRRSNKTLPEREYWTSRTTPVSVRRPCLRATVRLAAFLEVFHFLLLT